MGRGQKSRNGFKFGDFKVRFPSDGAASMTVKGLNIMPFLLFCTIL